MMPAEWLQIVLGIKYFFLPLTSIQIVQVESHVLPAPLNFSIIIALPRFAGAVVITLRVVVILLEAGHAWSTAACWSVVTLIAPAFLVLCGAWARLWRWWRSCQNIAAPS